MHDYALIQTVVICVRRYYGNVLGVGKCQWESENFSLYFIYSSQVQLNFASLLLAKSVPLKVALMNQIISISIHVMFLFLKFKCKYVSNMQPFFLAVTVANLKAFATLTRFGHHSQIKFIFSYVSASPYFILLSLLL